VSERALKACADYARLSGVIKALTRTIGESIGRCNGVDGDLNTTHLKEAYKPDMQGFPPEAVYMEPEDIPDYLSTCSHCLAAHEAIQMRKTARKSLAAVKRHITMLGRAENVRRAK